MDNGLYQLILNFKYFYGKSEVRIFILSRSILDTKTIQPAVRTIKLCLSQKMYKNPSCKIYNKKWYS